MIIDGKAEAAKIKSDLATKADDFVRTRGRAPCLAVILVGDDPASSIYVRSKIKACEKVGIASIEERLRGSVTQDMVLSLIRYFNRRDDVDGILVQLPLPDHIDGLAVIDAIDPKKDVDGFHPYNAGRLAQRNPALVACTPLGIVHLLKTVHPSLKGMHAVIVGASNIVGRPVGQLLLIEGCTVTTTHRFTKDTAALTRQGDIVVAAAGKPGLVTREWIKPDATVIDVGISRVDGQIVGDVDFESVQTVAGAITPVPGGVGPMTIAMLLRNTLEAANGRT